MKLLVKSLVLALLLAETDAYKLMMKNLHRLRDDESEDIDADDAGINEGPLDDDGDLVAYQ